MPEEKTVVIDGENRETSMVEYVAELNENDLLDIAEMLVSLHSEEERILNEKKAAASKYGAMIKQNEADRNRLMIMLRDKEEHREEECYSQYDFEEGILYYISTVTGESVSSRPITNEERQISIIDSCSINEGPGTVDNTKNDEEAGDTVGDIQTDKIDLQAKIVDNPICHMKPMLLSKNEEGNEYWTCSVCGSSKDLSKLA